MKTEHSCLPARGQADPRLLLCAVAATQHELLIGLPVRPRQCLIVKKLL